MDVVVLAAVDVVLALVDVVVLAIVEVVVLILVEVVLALVLVGGLGFSETVHPNQRSSTSFWNIATAR